MAWDTTKVNGDTLLDEDDILNAFVTAYPPMDKRLQGFRYLEGIMRVSIIVQGAPYAQGRVVFYAVPNGPHEGVGRFIYTTFNNARILPHVIVDPSQSATYILDLPALGPEGMINLTKIPYSWRLRAMVYDELGSGTTTVPIVNMEVRVTLIEPKLRGKVHPVTLVYGLETEAIGPSAIIRGVERGLRSHLESMKLSTYATLFSQISAQTAEKLKMMGFSRPPSVEVGNNLLSTGDAFTQVDGRSNVLVLGKSQQMASAINPDLMNGKIDEMELSYILSKPVVHHKTTISSTTPPTTSVASFLVAPNITGVGNNATNPSVGNQLMSHAFSWNGSITYSFEFVCSVFHRATVLIAYSPSNVTNIPYDEALTSLENINVTISGNTHVKWTIPWRQAAASSKTENGRIHVYLIDAIRSNGSTDGIHLDVLADLSKVQFHFPRAQLIGGDYIADTYSKDWIPSSDFVLLGDDRPNNTVIVGGDTPRSVRDLTARAVEAFTLGKSDTAVSFKNGPFAQQVCWSDRIIPWYYGWRGSYRYHGVYESESLNGDRVTVSFVPVPGTAETVTTTPAREAPFWATGIQVFNPTVMNGFDVIAPYAVREKNFSLGQEDFAESSYLHIHKNSSDGIVRVFKATGDDFVTGFFLGVPRFG